MCDLPYVIKASSLLGCHFAEKMASFETFDKQKQ